MWDAIVIGSGIGAGVGPDAGPDGQFGRLLAWLSDGALSFSACANPYDIVHLPGFEFGIAHPESAYREALEQRFSGQRAQIAGWFDVCDAARRAALTLFALHRMPAFMTWGLRLWRGAQAEHRAQHTLADVTRPGVPAAFVGGLMAAATIDPALWRKFSH